MQLKRSSIKSVVKRVLLPLVVGAGLSLPALSWAVEPKLKVAAPQTASAPASQRVNINTASSHELSTKLVGVGAKKAEAIVAWRKANGSFKSSAQLMEVKGIGQSLYELNKDRIQL